MHNHEILNLFFHTAIGKVFSLKEIDNKIFNKDAGLKH